MECWTVEPAYSASSQRSRFQGFRNEFSRLAFTGRFQYSRGECHTNRTTFLRAPMWYRLSKCAARTTRLGDNERVNIKDTIATINQMQADGVIERYAIGGAVGATFYLEPVATLDVDIFIDFHPEAGNLLATPQPLFDYLKARGGRMDGEYIVIAGWPVQFLPPASPLIEEALA